MKNQNTKITQEIKSALGLSELTGYPQKVADAIIPVIEVNKKIVNIVRSIQTSANPIYVIPARKDFYLTYCSMNIIDTLGAVPSILITPKDGVEVAILTAAAGIATVAVDALPAQTPTINFNPPILLERGSTISSGAESPDIGTWTIAGYLVEDVGD